MLIYAIALAVIWCLIKMTKNDAQFLDNYVRVYTLRSFKTALLVFLPLTFLAVCRWNVGIDSVYGGTYWTAYRNTINGNNILGFEPIFYLFMRLCANSGVSFWGFLALHSLLFMSCSVYAIKRGSVSIFLSTLLFFSLFVYFDSYSSLRQSLTEALGMVCISIMMTAEESKKKDIIVLLILAFACGLHSIALMYMPIYFFCKKEFSLKGIVLVFIASMLAYPILQRVFAAIMRMFFAEKYSFIGVSSYNLILSATVVLLCILFYDPIRQTSKFGYKIVNLALVIFIVMLNSGALLLPYRCFDCLKIGYVFIIPVLVKSLSNIRNRFIVATILSVIFGYWFINAFFIQKCVFANYQSIFENLAVIALP